ncbi:MAG: 2,3-bisphosphoglycerate-independent phosphoglycerate mutase [Candidatus Nanohaloarchaea archaeon]|nr:2,3-bisphosphoglycerate-independent phosphoglycerate mutase [Candidatus Nanohaloarchaea archaeon]
MNGVVLAVLDGIGIRDETEGNAVKQADTPALDRLFREKPHTELAAYGEAVGLPEGYIGNSEVGHLHLGAGRVIPQELTRINQAISDGSFFDNATLHGAADRVAAGGTVHLMGITSDGGVHGHLDHLLALIEFFAAEDCDVVVHAFLDGRDVEPESAARYLERIEETADAAGTGHIASFMGRYYAMDRDNNWDRTEQAYRALVDGDAHTATDWRSGLEARYREDRNDYFVEPTIIEDRFDPVAEGDVVVFANYRKDRARQLTRALTGDGFDRFTTETTFQMVTMMPYDDFDVPTVFDQQAVEDTVGEVLARNGMQQLRLSESQKEPHVTYFFDGQRETRFPGTDVTIFDSADVSAYDEKPEMEAAQVTDAAVEAVEDGEHRFVLINYPNCDLVGHTGDLEAAVTAVEVVDRAAGRLAAAARENDYALILTSDHGTCEELVGEYETSHTLNPVPFCIVHDRLDMSLDTGGLPRIAPTVLDLLSLPRPDSYDRSLIR